MNAAAIIDDIGYKNGDKSATFVHALSFQHDRGGEHQTTHRRTGFDMPQTSSDTEVVGNLLVCAFDGEHRDGIAHHIVTTAKSV